uniref:Secreted protein n=1 Tax=Heterorhabditis bacteriophora TaxID=37862 RepID=A0A1I7XNJ7_HETBA
MVMVCLAYQSTRSDPLCSPGEIQMSRISQAKYLQSRTCVGRQYILASQKRKSGLRSCNITVYCVYNLLGDNRDTRCGVKRRLQSKS